MEADVREVGLCHLQQIAAFGKKHIAAIFVFRHVLELTATEVVDFGGVVGVDPAGLEERYRLPTALGAILMQETILDDFKLQLAYSAYYPTVVVLVGKYLSHTFSHELVEPLLQLFRLHRIGIFDILEHLGRE